MELFELNNFMEMMMKTILLSRLIIMKMEISNDTLLIDKTMTNVVSFVTITISTIIAIGR